MVPRKLTKEEAQHLRDSLLGAYRWQYIASGVQNERFMEIVGEMLIEQQMSRIVAALGPLLASANAP